MYKIIIMMMLILTATVQAEPVVDTKTEYYSVDGETAKAIRKDMNAKRSGKFDAYTSWGINWHFYWDNQPTACTLTQVNTKVAVKFTLPQLATDSVADEDAKQRWDSYYTALVTHENGHRDLGIAAATAIEKALLAMGSRNNCKILEKDANSLAHSLVKKYNADNKQYDIDTNHGMKYGAVFP